MFSRPKSTFASLNINIITAFLNTMSEQDKRYRLPSDLSWCLWDATSDRNMPEIKKLLDLANTLGIKETLIDQLYMNAIKWQYNKKELDELLDICPINPTRKIHYQTSPGCANRSLSEATYKTGSLLEISDHWGNTKKYKESLAKNLHLHTAKEKDALFSEQGVAKKRRM